MNRLCPCGTMPATSEGRDQNTIQYFDGERLISADEGEGCTVHQQVRRRGAGFIQLPLYTLHNPVGFFFIFRCGKAGAKIVEQGVFRLRNRFFLSALLPSF